MPIKDDEYLIKNICNEFACIENPKRLSIKWINDFLDE
jgi:hypothetical protein